MGLNYRDRVPIYVGKPGSGLVVTFNALLQRFEIDAPDGLGAAALTTDSTLRGNFTEGDAGGVAVEFVLSTIPDEAVVAATDTLIAVSELVLDEDSGVELGIPKRVTVEDLLVAGLGLSAVEDAVTAIAETAAIAQFGELDGITDDAAARANLDVYSTGQVDALVAASAAGVGNRARVRAATTADITIATALNPGDVLDGVTLVAEDQVLVKNQSTAGENGIYVVDATPYRAAEFNAFDELPGALVAVEEGTANADTIWLCTANAGGTLGTTAVSWSKLIIAGELLAANNLSEVASPSTARTNIGALGDGSSTVTTGVTLVNGGATTVVPLVVKAVASQSGNLQQWQDSAGTILASVGAGGSIVTTQNLYTPNVQAQQGTGPYLDMATAGITVLNRTTASNVPLIVKGMAAQTGALTLWQNSAGTGLAAMGAAGDFYASSVGDAAATGPYFQMGSTGITAVNRTTVGNVPLTIKGMAGQTGNLTQWIDSNSNALASVTASGNFYGAAVGDKNASGPYLALNANGMVATNRNTVGNVPLVVKGMASQTGNLQEWQNDSATVLARVSANGTISASGSGVLTPYVQTSGGGGVFLGMDGSTVRVENATTASNVALTVKGMSSQSGDLTQWKDSAGTLMARITAAGNYYGPAVGDVSQTGPYISMATTSMTVFNRTTASNVPLVVKGMASQSGALTQWQDSAGVVLAQVSSSGSFYGPYFQAAAGTGPYLDLASAAAVLVTNRTTTSNVPFIVKGMASQSGSLQQWQDSAGTALAWVSSTGAIATNGGLVAATLGSASSGYPYLSLGNNSITVLNRTTASNVPLIVKGMAAQTGNLTEWQDSAGVVTAFVSSVGGVAATGGIIAPYMVNATNTETYIALTGGSVLLQNRNTTTNKALIVQGMAAQTGDLVQAQDSSGTVVAAITAAGALELGHASDTTIARISAGRVGVEGNPIVLEQQAINAQTGTTYTLAASDCGKLVTLSNASAITLTLPQDSDATIPIGTYIDIYQLGAGQVTVAAGTGASIQKRAATAKLDGQYASAFVQKVAANTYRLAGELAAS